MKTEHQHVHLILVKQIFVGGGIVTITYSPKK